MDQFSLFTSSYKSIRYYDEDEKMNLLIQGSKINENEQNLDFYNEEIAYNNDLAFSLTESSPIKNTNLGYHNPEDLIQITVNFESNPNQTNQNLYEMETTYLYYSCSFQKLPKTSITLNLCDLKMMKI